MKILIEGDIDRKKLIKLGRLMVKMYKGKKEHVNFLILEGTEKLSVESATKLIMEMWND